MHGEELNTETTTAEIPILRDLSVLGKVYGYYSDGVDTDKAANTTTTSCISALSKRLVSNVLCTRSHHLRTMPTCVTVYTAEFV